ncbi:hypothetical protein JCM8208_004804 [Rhodotorula glutinis]
MARPDRQSAPAALAGALPPAPRLDNTTADQPAQHPQPPPAPSQELQGPLQAGRNPPPALAGTHPRANAPSRIPTRTTQGQQAKARPGTSATSRTSELKMLTDPGQRDPTSSTSAPRATSTSSSSAAHRVDPTNANALAGPSTVPVGKKRTSDADGGGDPKRARGPDGPVARRDQGNVGPNDDGGGGSAQLGPLRNKRKGTAQATLALGPIKRSVAFGGGGSSTSAVKGGKGKVALVPQQHKPQPSGSSGLQVTGKVGVGVGRDVKGKGKAREVEEQGDAGGKNQPQELKDDIERPKIGLKRQGKPPSSTASSSAPVGAAAGPGRPSAWAASKSAQRPAPPPPQVPPTATSASQASLHVPPPSRRPAETALYERKTSTLAEVRDRKAAAAAQQAADAADAAAARELELKQLADKQKQHRRALAPSPRPKVRERDTDTRAIGGLVLYGASRSNTRDNNVDPGARVDVGGGPGPSTAAHRRSQEEPASPRPQQQREGLIDARPIRPLITLGDEAKGRAAAGAGAGRLVGGVEGPERAGSRTGGTLGGALMAMGRAPSEPADDSDDGYARDSSSDGAHFPHDGDDDSLQALAELDTGNANLDLGAAIKELLEVDADDLDLPDAAERVAAVHAGRDGRPEGERAGQPPKEGEEVAAGEEADVGPAPMGGDLGQVVQGAVELEEEHEGALRPQARAQLDKPIIAVPSSPNQQVHENEHAVDRDRNRDQPKDKDDVEATLLAHAPHPGSDAEEEGEGGWDGQGESADGDRSVELGMGDVASSESDGSRDGEVEEELEQGHNAQAEAGAAVEIEAVELEDEGDEGMDGYEADPEDGMFAQGQHGDKEGKGMIGERGEGGLEEGGLEEEEPSMLGDLGGGASPGLDRGTALEAQRRSPSPSPEANPDPRNSVADGSRRQSVGRLDLSGGEKGNDRLGGGNGDVTFDLDLGLMADPNQEFGGGYDDDDEEAPNISPTNGKAKQNPAKDRLHLPGHERAGQEPMSDDEEDEGERTGEGEGEGAAEGERGSAARAADSSSPVARRSSSVRRGKQVQRSTVLEAEKGGSKRERGRGSAARAAADGSSPPVPDDEEDGDERQGDGDGEGTGELVGGSAAREAARVISCSSDDDDNDDDSHAAAAVADADIRSETESSSSEDSDVYLGRPSRRKKKPVKRRSLRVLTRHRKAYEERRDALGRITAAMM